MHHVHVEMDGGIDGSVHSPVAIKHCKISLFFLVLSMETHGENHSGESNANSSLDCLKLLNLRFVVSSLNCTWKNKPLRPSSLASMGNFHLIAGEFQLQTARDVLQESPV